MDNKLELPLPRHTIETGGTCVLEEHAEKLETAYEMVHGEVERLKLRLAEYEDPSTHFPRCVNCNRVLASPDCPTCAERLENSKNLRLQRDTLLDACIELTEHIEVPPENCSCHISAPCSNCLTWSALRESLKAAKLIINRVKEMQDDA